MQHYVEMSLPHRESLIWRGFADRRELLRQVFLPALPPSASTTPLCHRFDFAKRIKNKARLQGV